MGGLQTLTITKVITGNIALSLGMIGVLSIVRYRKPVLRVTYESEYYYVKKIRLTIDSNIRYSIVSGTHTKKICKFTIKV